MEASIASIYVPGGMDRCSRHGCVGLGQAYRQQQEEGALLVDCRVDWSYAQEHAEGAVNLPLFRGVTGNDLYATLKRLAMGSFALKATGALLPLLQRFPNHIEERMQSCCRSGLCFRLIG